MIAEEAKLISNFEFVWITDGAEWTGAKGNLEETYKIHDLMFNIDVMRFSMSFMVLLESAF